MQFEKEFLCDKENTPGRPLASCSAPQQGGEGGRACVVPAQN